MNNRNKKQRWKKCLEKDLLPEIRYLIKLKIVYKKLEDIFVGSKKYPEKSYFYWYLGQVHAASIVSGVYRLIDERKDVVSLLRLLVEVYKYPELVSRRAYTRLTRNLYRDQFDYREEKRRLNNEFTDRAGNGQYINPSILNGDIKQIESVSKKIARFRHKFVSHHAYNQKRYRLKPTFKQAHDCVGRLADIFHKYRLLIIGSGTEIIENWEIRKIENDILKIFNASKEKENDL